MEMTKLVFITLTALMSSAPVAHSHELSYQDFAVVPAVESQLLTSDRLECLYKKRCLEDGTRVGRGLASEKRLPRRPF